MERHYGVGWGSKSLKPGGRKMNSAAPGRCGRRTPGVRDSSFFGSRHPIRSPEAAETPVRTRRMAKAGAFNVNLARFALSCSRRVRERVAKVLERDGKSVVTPSGVPGLAVQIGLHSAVKGTEGVLTRKPAVC